MHQCNSNPTEAKGCTNKLVSDDLLHEYEAARNTEEEP